MENRTIEQQTADTILQRVQTLCLGGKEYVIAPPTLGTLILVSEVVAKLPNVTFSEDSIVTDALRDARHYRQLADIAAIIILGSKRLECEEVIETRKFFGLIRKKRIVRVNMLRRVSNELMDNVELRELSAAMATLFGSMQTEHFFATASFLTSINLTKTTRKEAKATASGR